MHGIVIFLQIVAACDFHMCIGHIQKRIMKSDGEWGRLLCVLSIHVKLGGPGDEAATLYIHQHACTCASTVTDATVSLIKSCAIILFVGLLLLVIFTCVLSHSEVNHEI